MRQGSDKAKPITDQWLPAFVIVDDRDKPVGTIEVFSCSFSSCFLVVFNTWIQQSQLIQAASYVLILLIMHLCSSVLTGPKAHLP